MSHHQNEVYNECIKELLYEPIENLNFEGAYNKDASHLQQYVDRETHILSQIAKFKDFLMAHYTDKALTKDMAYEANRLVKIIAYLEGKLPRVYWVNGVKKIFES